MKLVNKVLFLILNHKLFLFLMVTLFDDVQLFDESVHAANTKQVVGTINRNLDIMKQNSVIEDVHLAS